MAIVYRHRRLDTFQPFYIGIGKTISRAYRTDNRTKWWKRVVNKTEYLVEILARNISYEDAQELECFLISEYGRLDNKTGILVNQTNGGEGTLGRIVSDETKKKIGLSNTSKEFKKRKPHSEEAKLNMSKAQKGKKHSEERIKINSESHKGLKASDETKLKMGLVHKGNTNTLGLKHSDETKQKMSYAHKGKNYKGKEVIDINTGIVYKSITLACLDLNLSINTIWVKMKKENFNLKYINYGI